MMAQRVNAAMSSCLRRIEETQGAAEAKVLN